MVRYWNTNEIANAITDVSPNSLTINDLGLSYNNIKALSSLNWYKMWINFKNVQCSFCKLKFSNFPILFFDSESDQKLQFEWKSIRFEIGNEELNAIFSRNSNKSNSHNYLFILLKSVIGLVTSDLKTVSSFSKINKHFESLQTENLTQLDRFIIPTENLYQTTLEFNSDIYDYFWVNQAFAVEIFKAKSVSLQISYIDDLLKIK